MGMNAVEKSAYDSYMQIAAKFRRKANMTEQPGYASEWMKASLDAVLAASTIANGKTPDGT